MQSRFFFAFLGFAAMSAGKIQRKTQTSRHANVVASFLCLFFGGKKLKGSKLVSISTVSSSFTCMSVFLSQVRPILKLQPTQHSSQSVLQGASKTELTFYWVKILLQKLCAYTLFCPMHVRTHKGWPARGSPLLESFIYWQQLLSSSMQ